MQFKYYSITSSAMAPGLLVTGVGGVYGDWTGGVKNRAVAFCLPTEIINLERAFRTAKYAKYGKGKGLPVERFEMPFHPRYPRHPRLVLSVWALPPFAHLSPPSLRSTIPSINNIHSLRNVA
jgi:hypothetical protein